MTDSQRPARELHDRRNLLRRIPKVDQTLEAPAFRELAGRFGRRRTVAVLREVLDSLRTRLLEESIGPHRLAPDEIAEETAQRLERRARPSYRRVVNATGVVLHTGLGRAPLAPAVADTVASLSRHSQRVEIELETGQRGGRDHGCARLLEALLECEAATVVNNNAAGTMLILAALARGREVIVSRGELVEIGGSFRIPEILRESGATLREVGTTNRTHRPDYQDAIGQDTGLILKVHTSNYRVVGFTEEVGIEELAELGRQEGVPVVHDLGSGCMIDLSRRGRPGEDLVRRSLDAGADLVCFSGDKLLGGPQAGIIAGAGEAVDRCRRHPLYRAFRPGRLIYTALEETLRIYEEGEDRAAEAIPSLRRILMTEPELAERANELERALAGVPGIEAGVVECRSQAGSGSLPARDYPSRGVAVAAVDLPAEELARRLRTGDPSVLVRVRDDSILLDMRTIEADELPLIAERMRASTGG